VATKPQKRNARGGVSSHSRGGSRPAAIPVLYETDLEEHLRSPAIHARMERVHRLLGEHGAAHAPGVDR